ncbi:MAG: riboflavin synthase [Myxococcota bacterium]|nr:riboflavin synthase [Myxococcota bacterium]
MFTGLVEATGTIIAMEERPGSRRITIAAPALASRLQTGASISVSGVCLTALDIEPDADPPIFHADLAAETMARTSLAALAPGDKVNLELPTPSGAPLGGHIVQGHVDGTGTLLSLEAVTADADPAFADWWLRVTVPPGASRYIVEKGSIAIEGISLTIARVDFSASEGEVVSVAIIPHTYLATNLHTLKPGRRMNIEADVLMKLSLGAQRPGFDLTLDYLVANGY